MLVLGFILSDVHFCLSYEKVNCYNIQFIKTAMLSDRKYFLVCIYVSEILFLFKKYEKKQIMMVLALISPNYLFCKISKNKHVTKCQN